MQFGMGLPILFFFFYFFIRLYIYAAKNIHICYSILFYSLFYIPNFYILLLFVYSDILQYTYIYIYTCIFNILQNQIQ